MPARAEPPSLLLTDPMQGKENVMRSDFFSVEAFRRLETVKTRATGCTRMSSAAGPYQGRGTETIGGQLPRSSKTGQADIERLPRTRWVNRPASRIIVSQSGFLSGRQDNV